MNTTIIIMAAGIGSRFGTGIKQLAKMAPNGEIIMDFSSCFCDSKSNRSRI